MNACNAGEYMIGIHEGFNRIACCPTGVSVSEYGDGPGQAQSHQTVHAYNFLAIGQSWCGGNPAVTAHSCGDWSGTYSGPGTGAPLMVGINISSNVFGCAI
jgi:hypothetical protein